LSKIEVNTVDVQCGSTLTLGSSGKTVTLAPGAAQSGFGRTGTVELVYYCQDYQSFNSNSFRVKDFLLIQQVQEQ
jgi:hypothetical protein